MDKTPMLQSQFCHAKRVTNGIFSFRISTSLSTTPSENTWTLLMPTVISSNFKEIDNCRAGKVKLGKGSEREKKERGTPSPQFPRFISPPLNPAQTAVST